jgi:hypothetical protein
MRRLERLGQEARAGAERNLRDMKKYNADWAPVVLIKDAQGKVTIVGLRGHPEQ